MSSIYSKEYRLIIKALRETRISQGITQTKLAKALDRPQSFVAKFENGERRLDIVEFIHISQLLTINPIQIMNELTSKLEPLRK